MPRHSRAIPEQARAFAEALFRREQYERTGLYPVDYFSIVTGYSPSKIKDHIKSGMWRENEVWLRDDKGEPQIFIPGFNRWVKREEPVPIVPTLVVKHPEPKPPKPPAAPVRTALYRHFDANGALLYVGVSLSAVQRLADHNRTSHWSRNIAAMTVEWHPSREEALQAEKAAIQAERPLHNIMHAKH